LCNGATTENKEKQKLKASDELSQTVEEPIPGLFLYENFITEEEERQILDELDGKAFREDFLPWKVSTFNGRHAGKRWGVHCNLRERKVTEAENPLPRFIAELLLPKLKRCPAMKGIAPNEANAIDYCRRSGHYLAAHVDDRQLSKEPIANLSLAGDCYMTFRNTKRNTAGPTVKRVLLPRRCLQILTGKARYDYSHGIDHAGLLSDRRVSVTMRESPLTEAPPKTKETSLSKVCR
jgi:alkylated DNA repair dioxygenase AlkB